MSFLPEFDQEFLADKGFAYTEKKDGDLRAIIMHDVVLPEGKYFALDPSGQPVPVTRADILIKIPDQYPDTKLDSFFARPFLKMAEGRADPPNSTGTERLFDQDWQFWSRHLNTAGYWRPGIDSLATYWNLVLQALRSA